MDKIPKCQIPKQVRNDSRVFAFTLAEVLITLVIIGVIAALTIPNLLQKYQEQATVKKVQKFYSNLSNAYNLAVKDNGAVEEWNATDYTSESAEKIYENLFKPYFKIAKNCGLSNNGNCIKNTYYKALNNNNWSNYGSSNVYYKATLSDGAAIWFRGASEGELNNSAISIVVFYDTNGEKEPNQWGRDLFHFVIKKNKAIPVGIQSGDYSVSPFNNYCKKTATGDGCAAWVIYKGNMDYLHCDGLTWNSRSCKDK